MAQDMAHIDVNAVLGFDAGPDNFYNAPVPPWVAGATPGWYYGSNPEKYPDLWCLHDVRNLIFCITWETVLSLFWSIIQIVHVQIPVVLSQRSTLSYSKTSAYATTNDYNQDGGHYDHDHDYCNCYCNRNPRSFGWLSPDIQQHYCRRTSRWLHDIRSRWNSFRY